MNMTNPLERLHAWYNAYVEGALDQEQPRFWFLFWGSVALSCAGFYVYTLWIEKLIDVSIQRLLNGVVTTFCILFPFLMLRRLNYLAVYTTLVLVFFYAKTSLLDLLFHDEQGTGRFVIDLVIYCLIGLLIRKLLFLAPRSSK